MCIGKGVKVALAALALCAGYLTSAQAQVPIYVDTYRPYILAPGEGRGSLMRMVEMVLREAAIDHQFVYQDYAFGFRQVQTQTLAASAPWRRSKDWAPLFHYSKPLVVIETGYYYNKRFHRDGMTPSDLGRLKLGKLESYGYEGAVRAPLDKAEAAGRLSVYGNETEALNALLAGDIDAIPLQKVVAEATIATGFSQLAQLLVPVDGLKTAIPFHLIASKTPEGARFIADFDRAFDALGADGVLSAQYANRGIAKSIAYDFVTLVVAEGFPTIIGKAPDQPDQQYAVPEGTRALVLSWSDRLRSPIPSDNLFRTMVDETALLILNGPHVGRELLVKNMHISMSE